MSFRNISRVRGMASSRAAALFAVLLLAASAAFMAGCENSPEPGVPEGFREASEAAIRRAGEIRDGAAGFSQTKVLRSLGRNPYNGFVYRFDDNLSSADIILPKTAGTVPGELFRHDFSDGIGPFSLTGGGADVDGGELVVDPAGGRYLYTDMNKGPLHLRRDDIDKVIITARHKAGSTMEFHINKGMPGGLPENKIWMTVVDVIPDGEYHDYIIDADRAFNPQIPWIEGFAVGLSDSGDDTVSVRSVEFVSLRSEYNARGAGVSSANRGGVLSPAMFMVNGSSVSYKVDVPRSGAKFQAGISIVDAREPVMFTVELDGDTVLRKNVGRVKVWKEVEVTVPGSDTGEVTVTLSCEGPSGGVGLWANPVIRSKPARRFNVIVLLQDAARADHLSCYGYPRVTTPVTDGLAAEGALFTDCYSQASKTIVSVPSFMTGLYPTATGVWKYPQVLDENYLTLAEAMRSQGYVTGSFLQNGHAGPEYGIEQGFGFLKFVGNRPEHAIGPDLYGWMSRNRDNNFFAYVHIIDPHGVYDPGEPYDGWYKAVKDGTPVERDTRLLDPEWVKEPTSEGRVALYDGELRRNDEAIKGLLAKLEQLGIYDDTMIVMVSDHGEFQGEHGLWEHNDPTYRPSVNVPMIFHYPAGIKGPLVIGENVQMVDLFPTVLDFAGVDAHGMLLQGDSLRGMMEGSGSPPSRICVSDETMYRSAGDGQGPCGSIFYGDMHFMSTRSPRLDREGRRHNMLFDTESDPGESVNLVHGGATEKAFMDTLSELQSINVEINSSITRGKSRKVNVNPVTRERLKALGYVQ